MSKNNNLSKSAERKCYCGRRISLGELKDGVGTISYECPDCFHARYAKPLTSAEFYSQFKRIPTSKSELHELQQNPEKTL